jgi:uncharacterized membrane protein
VSTRLGVRLQVAAVFALIVAYEGLSHYCNAGAGGLGSGARTLGTMLALAPLVTLGCALLWRAVGPLAALFSALLVALLLHDNWQLLEANVTAVYMVQECAVYALLTLSFGGSLRAGSIAYCTRLADKVHGPLTPRELRYTRQVTAAWTVFFGILSAMTFALYYTVPLRVWSLFANVCTMPLVALMFGTEYAVRRRVLPPADRGGILATVRAFLMSPR